MAKGIKEDGTEFKYIDKNYDNMKNFVLADKNCNSFLKFCVNISDEKRNLLREKRKHANRK